ncbi:tryptophan synthase alpha chain [Formosimonas limnophila]|uniref:Tryptophan synthase alpha chain n=1 Tax=Formosimonas limnophila TaxID=1384487 RepID=A0A8J3CLV5_9BURK|nr:tryptophan synthase subunit alpha [Formosimonas limnophila]GHA67405.1 tryptophan synthase alpha chain [Formosimonas limnophila]
MARLSPVLAANKAANRKNLVTFITAGDPNLSVTLQLMHTLVESGVDVIELGVPFSDPMADGPVIQRASERAVANGVGLTDVLQLVREFRVTNPNTPVVLMGYANPVECMGQETFIQNAVAAGVDGALVVDYPPEESTDFSAKASAAGLNVIYLVAPTSTDERMRDTAAVASGFIYYVSLKGVTGAGTLDVSDVAQKVAKLREYTDLPINVGFGISDATSAKAVASVADGVVIGSKLITLVEDAVRDGTDANAIIKAWLSGIRVALDTQ